MKVTLKTLVILLGGDSGRSGDIFQNLIEDTVSETIPAKLKLSF